MKVSEKAERSVQIITARVMLAKHAPDPEERARNTGFVKGFAEAMAVWTPPHVIETIQKDAAVAIEQAEAGYQKEKEESEAVARIRNSRIIVPGYYALGRN